MRKLMISVLTILSVSCSNNRIQYPVAHKGDTVDNYFGTEVADPYRWLEDDMSQETAEWVAAENKVTEEYLSKIPYREKIKERLTKLWDYSRMGNLNKKGDYYFYSFNSGLQNQDVIMYKKNLSDAGQVFLNPNSLSEDGTAALATFSPSNDGKYAAYAIAKAGSDWNEIYVKEIEGLKDLDDHLKWIKFSSISWYKNGFYYSRFNEPKEGDALKGENLNNKVYYHKVGTPQSADILVYEDVEHPSWSFNASVSDDEKFLIISAIESTTGNAVYVKDLSDKNGGFIRLVDNFEHDYSFRGSKGNRIFLLTNANAPKYKLVGIDMDRTDPSSWVDLIPENPSQVLENCDFAGDKIVAKYLKDARNLLSVFSNEGQYLYDIELPGIGTVTYFQSDMQHNEAFYQFTSFNYPSSLFSYNALTNKGELVFAPQVDFDPEAYVVDQVFYTSKDATKVPMFIVHKKDLKLDGNNPTLLYGYGGFNITISPAFSVKNIILLENNGIFAVANIRGGGEYGEEWHMAGTVLKKQNVFDDFIAAAQYLIDNKYTSPKRLAVSGGSNGGLLIGAVTNQRPDLFAVALPAVGVMDMLRYQNFTIGRYWASDYGTSEDSVQFNYLYKYSPLHNIKEGIKYPAIMATTGDHDDRVVPAHTFKYIATLQDTYKGKNPILVRIETNAGHGAGKPMAKIITEVADFWAFTFYNLNFEPKY
ncbi:MAG: S9 family peptidase [Bacteroidales bacterium]|nr:S9 family peptidase [Bacteroidales bacterium]MCB8999896.1 S9 family peptidase [Bacteroidales bacterium]